MRWLGALTFRCLQVTIKPSPIKKSIGFMSKRHIYWILGIAIVLFGLVIVSLLMRGSTKEPTGQAITQSDASIDNNEVPVSTKQILTIAESAGFGSFVFLDDDLLAVGAPFADGGNGVIHVFRQIDQRWQFDYGLSRESLPDLEFEQFEHFGTSFFFWDDILIISVAKTPEDPLEGGGVLYVLGNQDGRWVLRQELSVDTNPELTGHYGLFRGITHFNVSSDNEELYITTPSVIHIMKKEKGQLVSVSMIQERFLEQPIGYLPIEEKYEPVCCTPRSGNDDGILAVGNPEWQENTPATGAVFVFKNDKEPWVLEQEISNTTLPALDLPAGVAFGTSIHLDNGKMAVGAPGKDSSSEVNLVYVLKQDRDRWSVELRILALPE